MDYDYDHEADYGGRILWGRFVFWGIVIVLAFVLGRCTSGDVSEAELNQANQRITTLSSEKALLEDELDAAQAGGAGDGQRDGGGQDGGRERGGQDRGDGQASGNNDQETDAEAEDAEEEVQTYTVQSGDTLSSIAEQFYGDVTAYDAIVEANNLSSESPLRVGQVLEIPPNP